MLINWFFSKTYKQKCPDGTIRFIHKNIDRALPLAIKNTQARLNTDLSVQKKVAAKLKTEYAEKISGLLYTINEQNQSLMMGFRLAYIAYQADPCSNNDYLLRQAEELNAGQQRLLELKTEISGLVRLAASYPNNPEKVLPIYHEIVTRLGESHVAVAAQTIVENKRGINNWIKGNILRWLSL